MFFLSKLGDLRKKRERKGLDRNSNVFFQAEIRNSRFFSRPNIRDLQKKKVFTEIQRVFPAEIRNSRIFFGRIQMILHKKRSSPKFKGFFQSKLGDLKKKKKKKRSSPTLSELQNRKIHYSSPNNGKFFTTSAPKSLWGAVFIFGAKIDLKSTKNVLVCIFFRPMGRLELPPPPAGYATGRLLTTVIY